MSWRTSPAGKAKNQWPEWVWQGSQSLGKSAELLAGQLTVHGYGAPISWNTDGGAIQDNPSRHDYNLDEQVNSFIQSAEGLGERMSGGWATSCGRADQIFSTRTPTTGCE